MLWSKIVFVKNIKKPPKKNKIKIFALHASNVYYTKKRKNAKWRRMKKYVKIMEIKCCNTEYSVV